MSKQKRRKKKDAYERLIDEAAFDVSKGAQATLDQTLGEMRKAGEQKIDETSFSTPEEELAYYTSISDEYGRLIKEAMEPEGERPATRKRDEKQIIHAKGRGLRVLMITSEREIFEEGSEVQERYIACNEYFDELHVIVLTREDAGDPTGILKYGAHMWVYPTASGGTLRSMYDAYRLAQKQLAFASGFRPDLVITTTPFEEGVVGYALTRRYRRAFLVELTEDPYDRYFPEAESGNKWRLWAMRFVLPRAQCVRTLYAQVSNKVLRKHPKLREHVMDLPYYLDLAYWRDATPDFNLKERYSQFSFIILAVAALRREQHVDQIIDACAPLLVQYKSVGLVLVGEGALQKELEKQVVERNLVGSVVLETDQEVTPSHMKSADVLISMAGAPANDIVLSKAAAAGLPITSVASEHARELIEDGESGFLCDAGEIVCFQSRLNEFLNKNNIRSAMAKKARERVFDHFSKSKTEYYRAFAQMCEECVLTSTHLGPTPEEEAAAEEKTPPDKGTP